MTDTKQKLKEYVTLDHDLTGFKIVEMTEVHRQDEEGRRSQTVGLFRDSAVAKVFADLEKANYHGIAKVLVLTDDIVAFIISDQDPVKLFDDEEEAARLRKETLASLSSAQRQILGFGE